SGRSRRRPPPPAHWRLPGNLGAWSLSSSPFSVDRRAFVCRFGQPLPPVQPIAYCVELSPGNRVGLGQGTRGREIPEPVVAGRDRGRAAGISDDTFRPPRADAYDRGANSCICPTPTWH